MKRIVTLAAVATLLSLFAGQLAGQNIRLLRDFDGTSANIIEVSGFGINFSAEVASFERVGSELRFTLRYPQSTNPLTGVEHEKLFIALEHYVAGTENLGGTLTITIIYRPNALSPFRDVSVTFATQTASGVFVPLESGWWSDYFLNQGNVGRGVSIDRVGDRVFVRALTYHALASIDDPSIPRAPGVWVNGSGLIRNNYLSVVVDSFHGGVCISCVRNQREARTPAGRLILASISPTTAVLAPPGERARMIELAAVPSDLDLDRLETSLTGRWLISGGDNAVFGGFPVTIGAEQHDPGARLYRYSLSFQFGTGRAECGPTINGCRIYVSFSGLDREFSLFEIPSAGVGNRALYVQDTRRVWAPVMLRID